MSLSRARFVAPLLLLSAAASPPLRGASVNGISVDPAQATVGQSVTVSVGTTGICQVTLKLGDGASSMPVGPVHLAHTYLKAGTFKVTADGAAGCTGHAESDVTVKSNLAELCGKVNCSPAVVALGNLPAPPPCKPKIVKVVGDPPLEPGDEVIVLGSCFGKSGRLRLEGNVSISLTTNHWDSDYVDATVPAVTGVPDDPGAKLRLALPGSTSDVSQPGFRATRDLFPLLPGDVQVACLQSGTDANACQFFDAVTIPGMNTAGATFSGYHAGDNGAPDNIDSIAVALAPGWQIDHCSFYTYEEVSDGDPFIIPAFKGCTQGSKSSLLTVDYDLDIVDVLGYKGRVYVTGPKGTPYK